MINSRYWRRKAGWRSQCRPDNPADFDSRRAGHIWLVFETRKTRARKSSSCDGLQILTLFQIVRQQWNSPPTSRETEDYAVELPECSELIVVPDINAETAHRSRFAFGLRSSMMLPLENVMRGLATGRQDLSGVSGGGTTNHHPSWKFPPKESRPVMSIIQFL
jgi:hypothetical protein